MKVCNTCGVQKPIEQFYYIASRNWRNPKCISCVKERRLAIKNGEFKVTRNLPSIIVKDTGLFKKCTTCNETKSLSAFSNSRKGLHSSKCKVCTNIAAEIRRRSRGQRALSYPSIITEGSAKFKICKKCKCLLPVESFYLLNKGRKGLHASYCKTCQSIDSHESYLRRLKRLENYEPLPVAHLKCARCKCYKSTLDFHKNKSSMSGFATYCKDCIKLRKNDVKVSLAKVKICKVCHKELHSRKFNKALNSKDGLANVCKSCYNASRDRSKEKKYRSKSNRVEIVSNGYINFLLAAKGFTKPTREMIDIQIMTVLLRREARKQRKEEANANN